MKWRSWQQVSLKRQSISARHHTPEDIFFVVTAVRTSNPIVWETGVIITTTEQMLWTRKITSKIPQNRGNTRIFIIRGAIKFSRTASWGWPFWGHLHGLSQQIFPQKFLLCFVALKVFNVVSYATRVQTEFNPSTHSTALWLGLIQTASSFRVLILKACPSLFTEIPGARFKHYYCRQ